MTSRKVVPIKYTSRDFQSIRDDLINYAKRYYSDTFRDFNEASFGSLMIDTVAYVGDILSFYLDYQANESFLTTANEYENILKLGRQSGFRFRGSPTSFGTLAFYITVPAAANGLGPDTDYLPILRRGSTFSTGGSTQYILNESVNFANLENEIVVANVDSTTGNPISYAVRAYGQVLSGEITRESIAVGNYVKFLRLPVPGRYISEILSVTDSEGHEYFEVENLSQNVVFAQAENTGANKDTVKYLMKPIIVPRRYVVDYELGVTILQFGYGSEENLQTNLISDPSEISLKIHGKNYFTDTSFDPSKLTQTDKFGVVPSNTYLTVAFRQNLPDSINAAASTVTEIVTSDFTFPAYEAGTSLLSSRMNSVVASLESINPEPITGDISLPSPEELKIRIYGNLAAQNRAVTKQDYASLVYSMPVKFGAIKRISVVQDPDSFKRNLNMYVISEDSSGDLIKTNSTIKENLRAWISQYKMVNDTVDILDAYILNLSIDFTAVASRTGDKYSILEQASLALRRYHLSRTPEIGERFYISDIYAILRTIPGLLDVVDVRVNQRSSAGYSGFPFDISAATDPDGRFIEIPENVITEVKYPDTDIRGVIR